MGVNFNGDLSYQTGEGNAPETPPRPESPACLLLETLVPSDTEYSPTEESDAVVFEDILYQTGTAKFWLLPQEAVDELKATTDELKGLLKPSDPEGCIRNLADKARLLDAIQPLHMMHFLNQTQLEEFESIMQKWDLVADEFNFEPGFLQQALESNTLSMGGFLLTSAGQKVLERQQDVTRLRELYRLARERAEGLGYSIEGSALYRPQTEERHKAIEAYRTTRRNLIRWMSRANSVKQNAEEEPLKQVEEFLNEYKKGLEELRAEGPYNERHRRLTAEMNVLERFANEWKSYLETIIQLAKLGIVTPELALAEDPEKLTQGASHFQNYHQLYQQAQALTDQVSEKIDRWVTSTANEVQAPVFLFADERQEYRDYLQKMESLYHQAQALAAEHFPDMQFVWYEDIAPPRFSDEYEPQPINSVTRPGFPLREYLLASGEPSQGYLSVQQLLKRTDTKAQKTQLRLALAQEMSFPGERPATEYAFGEWLRQKGARAISSHMGLFNDQGQFEFERLEVLLDFQQVEIASLQDDAARERFQETLQTWLHADQQRQRLVRIDFSYVAQMLRLAGWLKDPTIHPLQAQEQEQQELSLPQPDDEKSHWVKTQVQTQWNRAEGSMTFKQLHLPPRDKAQENPVKVYLANKEGTPERNLGAYSLSCDLKFSQFAGAKLAWGVNIFDPRSLEVSHKSSTERVETNVSLGELEPQISAEAFLGVRAGAEAAIELNWLPPDDLDQQLHNYASMVELGMADHHGGEWHALCRSQLMIQAGWGAGGSVDFQLAWQGGRFRIRIKASVFFGGGVGGRIELELDLHKLNLWMAMINQALRDNDYRRLEWVDQDSFTLLSQLGFLQTFLQVEVGLLMLRGADSVRSLYRAMTHGKHTGPIAYTLVEDPRQEQLKTWVQGFTPEALGALLFTLTRTPREFEVESHQPGQDNETYSRDQAHILQQQAIARCLSFLVAGAEKEASSEAPAWSATEPLPEQMLFTKAVARVHHEGEKTATDSQEAYCVNRARLDRFMERTVENITDNEDIKIEIASYHRHADQLGLAYQGQCRPQWHYQLQNMSLNSL